MYNNHTSNQNWTIPGTSIPILKPHDFAIQKSKHVRVPLCNPFIMQHFEFLFRYRFGLWIGGGPRRRFIVEEPRWRRPTTFDLRQRTRDEGCAAHACSIRKLGKEPQERGITIEGDLKGAKQQPWWNARVLFSSYDDDDAEIICETNFTRLDSTHIWNGNLGIGRRIFREWTQIQNRWETGWTYWKRKKLVEDYQLL